MPYHIRKVKIITTRHEVWYQRSGTNMKYITHNTTPETVIAVGEPVIQIEEDFRELTPTERILYKGKEIRESDDDGR